MKECIGKVFSLDGRLEPCRDFSRYYHGGPGSIYEVVRVLDGIPMFLDDHLDRMEQSMRLTSTLLPCSRNQVTSIIGEVIAGNHMLNGNLKIVCQSVDTGRQLLIYVTEHQYPGPEQYKAGIPAVLMRASRPLPNAKQSDPEFSEKTSRVRIRESVHEVLLVDAQACITEGSRSNVFFIRKGVVLTPPVDDVLPGITRKHVIECCRAKNIPLRETRIPEADLKEMDAAFLSSTSRRVLPVNRIGDQAFPPDHPVIREIQHAFNNLITVYLLHAKMAKLD
jgi:branched-chain amino acid aminotransferase